GRSGRSESVRRGRESGSSRCDGVVAWRRAHCHGARWRLDIGQTSASSFRGTRSQMTTNTEFEIQGLCHVALVCRDMARTVEFYTDVLGMTLAKTVEIPGGGQHFFLDMGCGEYVAFFWFPDAPERAPGIASPESYPGGSGDLTSAHGSMNHL